MKKNSKIMRILIVFILIFSLIYMQAPTVFAGMLDDVIGESGPRPPDPVPPDDPPTQPSTPSTPEPSGPEIVRIPVYTTISGYVYEDAGQIKIGDANADGESSKVGVSGVIVNLKQGNTVVGTCTTGTNGYYSFSPAPGTYSLEFKYGYLTESNLNSLSVSQVRNRLKYNGHDYITVETPKKQEHIDVVEWEITQSGKGAAQVYLALDASYSMRNNQVTINGVTKTRLQVASEAAKGLIDELLDSGENIYVGIVIFTDEVYRAVSLTKEKNILYSALDDIVSNEWKRPNTNIVGALDKALESYANNDKSSSNRYLAVLSDGIPTSDGTHQTYSNMSETELMNTLKIIKNTTKNKVKKLKADGIKIFSLMVESDDEMENEWVKEIFDLPNSDIFISAKDGYEMVETIEEELKDYIITTTEEKSYTSSSTILAGYEDAERRKEVDSKFEIFKYDNTIYFDQITNYNATANDKQEALKLSQDTYMIVQGGSGYTIQAMPNPSSYEIYGDEDGDGEEEVVKIVQYYATGYSNQNVGLAKRPALSLVTKTTATGLKVILSNGATLDLHTRDAGTDVPIVQTIDAQLAHGATVQVEYTITVKNDSSIQCNYLELINYLPESFEYLENLSLITESKLNKNYGWIPIESLEDLKYEDGEGYISQYTLDTYGNRVALKLVLDNKGKGKNGFYIPPGGEYTVKLVASRTITSLYSIKDCENVTEVLVYKDSANRRMAYLEGVKNGSYDIGVLMGVFPGDSEGRDCSTSTNKVFVLPPTGGNKYKTQILPVSILTLTFVAVIIVLRKKKIKNKVFLFKSKMRE